MNVVRRYIIIFSSILIFLMIIEMLYHNDLALYKYLLIFSQICIIVSMIFSIRHENKTNGLKITQ